MKKALLLCVFSVLFIGTVGIMPLAAEAEESEYYYVNVQILKIFPYKLGYYVIYRKAGLGTAEAYIPHKWFDRRDARANLNLTNSNVNPYMTFFLKNGKFDHVNICASKDLKHPTWGTLSPSAPIEDKFNVEELALDF